MEKIAIVTGSTNNVGKGIAIKLSEDGYVVVITSRHGQEAKAVADNLPQKGTHYQVDFSNPSEIEGLFSFVQKQFHRLDVLVNNVAFTMNESILECSLETWDRTVNTNLRSYFLCTKFAAEIMKWNGGGDIVNITISKNRGIRNKLAYSVSKGGVNSLTMCAAVDLAPFNIRVNSIGIGPTGTPVGQKDYPDRKRGTEVRGIPGGRVGTPEDIANAVSFLVSQKASYIFGAIIPVDGGGNISS